MTDQISPESAVSPEGKGQEPPATEPSSASLRPRAPGWGVRATSARLRPHLSLLPLIGIIPPFLLATYALTQPWARARVLLVWGISRSPGATLLVVVTLAGMVAATVAAALRGHRLRIAAAVHLATGVLMVLVAFSAYRLVLRSGVRVLGVPLASVRPGQGLRLFALAAVFVLVLGAVEMGVARKRARGGATQVVVP